MSLKQEIETWVQALDSYDNNEFEMALKHFDGISDTSKILFNCGVIHATLGEHDKAVECYQRAVSLDKYLAVAYFQQGVSNFLVGDFEEALANFNDTLLYLRGNTYIDYEQLGLKFKLYSCEVLFNRGLCYIYLQQMDTGLEDLAFAQKEKMTPDHDVIDDAIAEQAEGYTVFSIPVGIVYRPNASKVKNLKTVNYLGTARLVASTDPKNAYTGFAGTANQPVITTREAKDDRPTDGISYAASNLVRNDITSRSMRQQSEPPTSRNVFPPTPPPENDGTSTSGAPVRPPPSRSATTPVSGGGMGNGGDQMGRTARANSMKNTGPYSGGGGFNGGGPSRTMSRKYAPTSARIEEDEYSPNSAYPPPRRGTIRAESEPRNGPSRYASQRGERGERGYGSQGQGQGRNRLFMEAQRGVDEEIEEYPDELYDMYRGDANYQNPYGTPAPPQTARRPTRTESRGAADRNGSGSGGGGGYGGMDMDRDRDSSNGSLDDFEMMDSSQMNRRGTNGRGQGGGRNRGNGSVSQMMGEGQGNSGNGEVRSVRVKMHHEDDTRYIMCNTNIDFEEFQDKVREKLGLRGRMKIKIKDEGDLITVGDRDDWDMQVIMARKSARRGGDDMARMEVWVQG